MSRKKFYDQIPQVMRVADFAEFFHFDLSTVHRMCTSGELGCQRRKGASIRIMKFHITDWMEKCDSLKSPEETTGTSDTLSPALAAQKLNQQERKMRAKLKSI